MAKISPKQYAQALFELTDGKNQKEIDKIIKKFLQQVKNNGNWSLRDEIVAQYIKIYNEANGIVVAEVTSARKLTKSELSDIEKFVKSKYKASTVELDEKVDEEIIGGLVVKVGDEMMDMSINNKMKQMQKYLMQ